MTHYLFYAHNLSLVGVCVKRIDAQPTSKHQAFTKPDSSVVSSIPRIIDERTPVEHSHMPPANNTTLDPEEAARFDQAAAEWWKPGGDLAPLHSMTPVRLDYVLGHVAAQFGCDLRAEKPLAGLRVLDAGCGGGLLAEPFCRLGASVLGIDPVESAVRAAEQHAEEAGLAIRYRTATIESMAKGTEPFHLILAMEVVEHLADAPVFLRAASHLLAPDGLMALSTLNRTRRSFALAILGAERILRWLPKGTHDWRKFLRPDELERMLRDAGLEPVHSAGFVYQPLSARWRIDERNLSVNYAMLAVPAPEPADSGA